MYILVLLAAIYIRYVVQLVVPMLLAALYATSASEHGQIDGANNTRSITHPTLLFITWSLYRISNNACLCASTTVLYLLLHAADAADVVYNKANEEISWAAKKSNTPGPAINNAGS